MLVITRGYLLKTYLLKVFFSPQDVDPERSSPARQMKSPEELCLEMLKKDREATWHDLAEIWLRSGFLLRFSKVGEALYNSTLIVNKLEGNFQHDYCFYYCKKQVKTATENILDVILPWLSVDPLTGFAVVFWGYGRYV